MSYQLMAWAVRQKTGSATRKTVLLALADRANGDTGRCDPSIKRLAADVEANTSTVRRAIQALAEQGLIEVVARKRDDGSPASNHYRFPKEAWGADPARGYPQDASTPTGADDGGGTGRMSPEPGIDPNRESEPGPLPAAPVAAEYDPAKGVKVKVEGEARPQDLVWNALAQAIDTDESPHGSRMRSAVLKIRVAIWGWVADTRGEPLLRDLVAADPAGYEMRAAETVALVARRIRDAHPGLTWGPEGIARHFREALRQADSSRTTQSIVEEVERESAG